VRPLAVVLVVAMLGSAAVVFYGLVMDRTGQAIAFTVAGMFVLGVTLAIAAFVLASGAVSEGRAGHVLRCLFAGLLGGLFAIAASGSLAGAVVFGVLSRSV
jgi:hypothetical protein